MGLYYRIWVDCITRLRSLETSKNNWQIKSMIIISIAMTLNLVLFMVILQREVFGYYFYEFNISSLTGFQNYICTILILFILPCLTINYILIFSHKRYEKLLKKYSYQNGKLILAYFLISTLSPIVLIWIGFFLSKI